MGKVKVHGNNDAMRPLKVELHRLLDEQLVIQETLSEEEILTRELKAKLMVAEKELVLARERGDELRKELIHANTRARLKRDDTIIELKKQVADLKGQQAEVEARLEEREKAMLKLVDEVASATADSSGGTGNLVECMREEQRRPQLLAEVEQLRSQLEETKAEMKRLVESSAPKREFERCEEDLQNTLAQLDQVHAVQSEASAKLGELSAQNEIKKDTIRSLEDALAASQKEAAELAARTDALLSEVEVLNASDKDSSARMVELEKAIGFYQNDVRALQAQCSNLNHALQQATISHENEMAEMASALNMMAAERNRALSEIAYFRRLVERMQVDFSKRTAALESQLSASAREKIELRASLKYREHDLEESEANALNTRMELVQSQQHSEALRLRAQQQQFLIDELETRLRATADRAADADARCRSAERSAQKASTQAASMRGLFESEASKRQADSRDHRKKILALESEALALQKATDEAQAERSRREVREQELVRMHEEKLRRVEDELQKSKKETSALKVTLAQTEARIADLDRARRSSELRPATQALISIEMEREELRRSRARSNAEISASEQRQHSLFTSVERLRKQLSNVPVRSTSRRRLSGVAVGRNAEGCDMNGAHKGAQEARGMGSRSGSRDGSSRPGERLIRLITFGLFGHTASSERRYHSQLPDDGSDGVFIKTTSST